MPSLVFRWVTAAAVAAVVTSCDRSPEPSARVSYPNVVYSGEYGAALVKSQQARPIEILVVTGSDGQARSVARLTSASASPASREKPWLRIDMEALLSRRRPPSVGDGRARQLFRKVAPPNNAALLVSFGDQPAAFHPFEIRAVTRHPASTASKLKMNGVDYVRYSRATSENHTLVVVLGGNDGAPASDEAAWLAVAGATSVTFDYITQFGADGACVNEVDVDRVATFVQRLADQERAHRLVLVGYSAGADLSLMLANGKLAGVSDVVALSPTLWRLNGAKGPGCSLPASPWRLDGRPVRYALNFPPTPAGFALSAGHKLGLVPQVVSARAALRALSPEQRRQLEIDTSKIEARVHLLAGELDDLTPAQESVEALCRKVARPSSCEVFPGAGHDLLGLPGSSPYCRVPKLALRGLNRTTYCGNTARARIAAMGLVERVAEVEPGAARIGVGGT